MRVTWRSGLVTVVAGGAWIAAAVGAIAAATGTPAAGHVWVAFEPVTAGLAAALTVSLVVWRFLGPLAVVWRTAERTGREAVAREAVLRRQQGNVRELYPTQ